MGENSTIKKFGEILAELRTKANLSQNKLAQIVKMNPSHISRIERGERKPPKKGNLLKIAEALELKEKDKDKLLIAAGYIISKTHYTSPIDFDEIICNEKNREADSEKLKKILQNETIRMIIKTLYDPKISSDLKHDIENQIRTFIKLIRKNILDRK